MKFIAPSTLRPTAASPCSRHAAGGLHLLRRGPPTAEAHEVDARQRQRDRRARPRHRPAGPDRPRRQSVKARASSPGPETSKRTAVPSGQPACLPTTNGMAPCTRSSDMAEARFPLAARAVEGVADVLLVHPAVERPAPP